MKEEEACIVYAAAWNRLNPEDLIAALDEDVNYSSQVVLTDMQGKDEVASYLRGKMDTIRSSPSARVFAELAETRPYPMNPSPAQPCVVISQGDPDNLVATVLFKVSSSGICQIAMCIIPPPQTTRRSGTFPA